MTGDAVQSCKHTIKFLALMLSEMLKLEGFETLSKFFNLGFKNTKKRELKFLCEIVGLPNFPFTSVSFYFMYF